MVTELLAAYPTLVAPLTNFDLFRDLHETRTSISELCVIQIMPHEWSNALNYGNNSDTGGYMRRLQWSNELQEKRYRYLIMRNGYHTSGVFLRGYGWSLVVVIQFMGVS